MWACCCIKCECAALSACAFVVFFKELLFLIIYTLIMTEYHTKIFNTKFIHEMKLL